MKRIIEKKRRRGSGRRKKNKRDEVGIRERMKCRRNEIAKDEEIINKEDSGTRTEANKQDEGSSNGRREGKRNKT